jgi:phosphoribosylglycinamide formyltransferase-1
MLRLAVLGSGSGTNFQSIAAAVAAGELTGVELVLVLSDVADAGILARAETAGVPARYLPADDYRTKLDGPQEQAYLEALRAAGAEYIALAGFMRMIKDGLLDAFARRIINIHPALLPAFPGLAAWEQALAYGVKQTGCTVHFVDKGMDTGPIIAQAAVPVRDDDTPKSLHARIQVQEHRLYPQVLQWLADGRVAVKGRQVTVKDS